MLRRRGNRSGAGPAAGAGASALKKDRKETGDGFTEAASCEYNSAVKREACFAKIKNDGGSKE